MDLELRVLDRINLLVDIMNTMAEGKTNIEAVNARTMKDEEAVIYLTIDIRDVDHMNVVIRKLRQIEGVISVRRAQPT